MNTVTITNQFDCTQRQLVSDIAEIIYNHIGYVIPVGCKKEKYFFDSQRPMEVSALHAAEEIFELFYGDSPSYDDDDYDE